MIEMRSRPYIVAAVSIAAAIAMVASPALAQSRRKASTQRAPQAIPYGGYAGPKRYNTDPDPNVQFEIMRQENWRKGG